MKYLIIHNKHASNLTSTWTFWCILIVILIVIFIATPLQAQKINGMSFRGPSDPISTSSVFNELKTSNANWVALIPQATLDRRTLQFIPDYQNHWWSETVEGTLHSIIEAKQAGFKIFLKPHIVLSALNLMDDSEMNGDKTMAAEWRGSLKLYTESDWVLLETAYRDYILQLAQVASDYDVELFSVGTELKLFVKYRPDFWHTLIQEVRSIYTGQITYAANWDEYMKVPFWQDLDYIGVDSYFPISNMKTPEVKGVAKKWKPIKRKLKKVSRQNKKQLILTEFGYRNVPYAGKKPWTHFSNEQVEPDNVAQANLHEAFFQTFWDERWVAGGFSWQWDANTESNINIDFTVQNKPALAVVQRWFDTTTED